MKKLLLASFLLGCWNKPEPQIPAYCTSKETFTATLLRCVDKSITKEESKQCREEIHNKCGLEMKE